MFSASKFLRPKSNPWANENGYNDAWLGLSNNNPYPVGSIDYQQYEWGYNEAKDDADELSSVPYYYPSNEYEDEVI